jgi:DNA repair exonuclease SbcCD ATPase subunit
LKLIRLRLKHFRSHRNTTLHFQRLTFIRGKNRTGKSSIVMAIALAMSGRNEVTDEGGKGYEDLIEDGASGASIELEFDSFSITVKLDRNTGRSFKVSLPNGRAILGRPATDWIAEHVATPDIVSACLSATRFFAMSVNDQAALLAHVLLPETLVLDPSVSEWLQANQLAVIVRPSLFATIEATYKSIAEARTDASRRIRDLKNIEEPDQPTSTRDEVKAKLQVLRDEEASLNRSLAEAREAIAADARNTEQITALDRQITEHRDRLVHSPALLPPDERSQLLTVAGKAQEHYELNGYLLAHQARVQAINDLLGALMSATESGACPTCKSPITPETREAIFGPLQRERDELNGKILEIQHRFTADGNVTEAVQSLERDDRNTSVRQRIGDAIEQLVAQKQQCEQRRATLQLPPEEGIGSIAILSGALDDRKQRIVKGLEVLVKVVELEDRHSEYRRQLAERTALETRHAELERLLDYFGPSGIKAKLISERLDIFTAKVNAVLQFWSYSMQFSIEPFTNRIHEFDTLVTLSPKQLSASEKYRLGVAFAVAIAQWTGFKMLICDGAEILDKNDKWQLAQALIQSDIEQAIVVATGVAGTFEEAGTIFYTLSKQAGVTVENLDEEYEAEAVTN